MTNISDIRKLSCYAVLKSGLSTSGYLEAHMRLVLLLIYRKQYKSIVLKDLVADFEAEFGYQIDYFAMRNILGLALTQGFLEQKRSFAKYHPTAKIMEFQSVQNDFIQKEAQYHKLICSFQGFAAEHGVKYSEDTASSIIAAYADTQKLEHISGHIESIINDSKADYLFGSYVLEQEKIHSPFFDYITDMVTGSILADCLTFHEDVLEAGDSLSSLTVVFDASPVFLMLGIDTAARESYYLSLLASLKNKGAQCVMFRHTYDEMQRVLVGAARWVDSIDYDSTKSSDTIEYFRSISASREDVEEYSYQLRKKINDLGITIIDQEYREEKYIHVIDEAKIYSAIVEYYRTTNPHFDEQSQKSTIEMDVKSISKIYMMRADQRPVHIRDCNCLFVTSNGSLSRIAKNYHCEIGYSDETLPCLFTDVFLGTYIWLDEPVKIIAMNQQQVISNAILAFEPSMKVLKKLNDTVSSLLEKGQITSEQCYALKGNRLVSEKLMAKTLGDPEEITDSTPFEILMEIRNEGKEEGRAEASAEASIRIEAIAATAQREKERYQHEFAQQANVNRQEKLKLIEIALKEKTKTEIKADRVIGIAFGIKKGLTVIVSGVAVLMAIALVVGIISLFVLKDSIIPAGVAQFCTVIPLVFAFISFAYSIWTKRSLNIVETTNQMIDSIYAWVCKKLGWSLAEYDTLKKEICELRQKQKEYQQEEREESA